MIKSVLSILLICLFLNAFSDVTSYHIGNQNEFIAVRNELYKNENYPDYIKAYPEIVHRLSSQKNTFELSFHFALLTESLFQLRDIATMQQLVTVVLPFTKKYNANAYHSVRLLYLYTAENAGNYDYVLKELKTIKPSNETRLLEADILLRQNKTHAAKVIFYSLLPKTTDRLQATAYNGLASCYYIDSELDSAEHAYLQALQIYSRIYDNKHTRYAQVLYNLGLIYGEQNDLNRSEKYFTEALYLYEKRLPQNHPRIAEAHATLGGLFMNKDDVESALYHFNQDKKITEAIYGKQATEAFYAYLNCGTTYALKEEYIDAKNELKTAYVISHKTFKNAHYQKALAALELSKVYKNMHLLDSALFYLQEAEDMELVLNPVSYRLIDIYYELGEVHRLLQHYKISRQYFQKSLDCSTQILGENNSYRIDAYRGMAINELAQHHLAQAENYINKAKIICTDKFGNITNKPDYWQIELIRFKINSEKFELHKPSADDIKNEIKQLQSCLILAQNVKNSYYTQENKLYYNRKIDELNQTALYLLTQFYPRQDTWFLNEVWFFAQSSKANLLRSRLQDFETEKSIPQLFRTQYDDIKKQIYFFEQNGQYDSLYFYQKQYAELVQKIGKAYPKYFALRFDEHIISIKEIQQSLSANEQYFSFYTAGDFYYLYAIDKFSVKNIRLANTAFTDSLIGVLNTAVAEKKYHKQKGTAIFKLLFSQVTLLEHITIEPSGNISFLPFDILSEDGQHYFLEDHTTVFSFSANTFFHKKNTATESNCLAIFPNFSGSGLSVLNFQLEKESINKLNDVSILSGQYATKKAVVWNLPKFGVIHFGTHLLYDTLRPLMSKLMLSNGEYLALDEIWKLQTPAQFVCLAACKSNAGKWQQGEGLQNFAWAFEYAGAANVLGTRWDAADEATAKLMADFYGLLKSGKNKTEALQSAKMHYLKNADAIAAQPFFWSHLILYGNHDEIKLKPKFLAHFWWMPVILLICFLIGISAIYKWKNK